jgi:uncharacterized membrane protein
MEPTAAAPAGTPRAQRTSFTPLAVIPIAAVLGGFLFFAAESSWYRIFLAVHVLAAVIWVGGGVIMMALSIAAERSGHVDSLVQIARSEAWVGMRVYAPSSLVLLVFGFVLTEKHDFGYGSFWIVVGMLGWAASTIAGMAFFGPQMQRLNRAIDERGVHDAEVQERLKRIQHAARLDVAVLVLVVIAMVMKPFS